MPVAGFEGYGVGCVKSFNERRKEFSLVDL